MSDYKDLLELRRLFRCVTLEEFVRFFFSINCDLSYAQNQWVDYQDAPLLWVTGHSYGEEFIQWIKPKDV